MDRHAAAGPALPKEPPLADISCVLLEFFRTSAKTILQANNHPIRRAPQEPPVQTLAAILADGVVLYEFLSYVDPHVREAYSVQRIRRQTPSSPLPHGPDPDADALARTYKGNTRRLLQVLPTVLDNTREYVGYPPPRSRHPVKSFVGTVEDSPPLKDPLPVTRLATLVMAIAIYGPRKQEFLTPILQLSQELMQPFRAAVARVSYTVSLPHPDTLLTASISNHPLQSRIPPIGSGASSPRSSQHNYMSPSQRGYMSPYGPHTPGHATPPVGVLQHLFMSPPGVVHQSLPSSPLAIHTPPVARSPHQPHRPITRSARHITDVSPRPPAIHVSASASPGSARGFRPPPSPARSNASESAASSDSRRPSRTKLRDRPPRPEQLVSVARSKNPDTFTSPPLKGPSTSQFSFGSDDGMARKYSLVTDEDPESRGSHSPPKPEDVMAATAATATARASAASAFAKKKQDDGVGIAQSMRELEKKQEAKQKVPTRTTTKPRSESNTSMSEEFFTPREDSLSPDVNLGPSRAVATERRKLSSTSVGSGSRRVQRTSSPRDKETGRLSESAPAVYSEEYLKNMVLQSVTSSVTQHISESSAPRRNQGQPSSSKVIIETSSEKPSLTKNPKLFRGDSFASTVDENNPANMASPAPSDIPSPSRRWQVSRQENIAENILSPETIFSPPTMPARHSRTNSATQTSPREAPPLFPQQLESPQMSISSTDYTMSDIDHQNQLKNQKVSFASHSRTLSGTEHPIKEISKEATPVGSQPASSDSSKFSLPPSAARSAASGSSNPQQDETNPNEDEVEVQYDQSRSEDERSDIEQPDPDTEERDADWNFPGERSSGVVMGEEEVYHSDIEHPRPPAEQSEYSMEDMPFSPERTVSAGYHTVSEHSVMDDERDNEYLRKERIPSPSSHTKNVESVIRSTGNSDGGREETGSTQYEGHSRRKPPVPPGHSPATIPYSTPTIGRRTPTSRDVPPTPPTPPPIETILESIRPSGRHYEDTRKELRPISTMAPSGELFQRLITIVQDSSEGVHEDDAGGEGDRSERDARGFRSTDPAISIPGEGPPSHASTHESTLPSGDIDADMEKVTGTIPHRSGQRPRAIRIATDILSMPPKPDTHPKDTKGDTFEEHTSVASFSDAFSDEKDRHWSYESQGMEGRTNEWDEAMRGDREAGIPFSPPTNDDENDDITDKDYPQSAEFSPEFNPADSSDRNIPDDSVDKLGAHSIYIKKNGISSDGVHIKVDRRRLDWLTKEVLSARDAVSRKELQMTAAEIQHREQQEILLLEKQDAQCLVHSMKRVLNERESELNNARNRLSMAIQNVSNQDTASQTSRSPSIADTEKLSKLITEGHEKLHTHINESETNAVQGFGTEMRSLFEEVQRAMVERMLELNEKRDEELQVLRTELENRERHVRELQKSGEELKTENKVYQEQATEMRIAKEESARNYELEMGHVTAQVELVNEFSKKLHDNFRETENLRRQVLHYQDKLSHITSASGVSQRQIKELREAVTRANDECARLRREADVSKRKGLEAVRRAEELEDLRYKDAALQSPRQFPDRQDRADSVSLQSQPVKPPGQNRPGGMGINARYHAASRSRNGSRSNKAPYALNAFLDKIFRKDGTNAPRRRHGTSRHKENSKAGSVSQSSRSGGRSRQSPRDHDRSHTQSAASRTSNGSVSSFRSASQRSGHSREFSENQQNII